MQIKESIRNALLQNSAGLGEVRIIQKVELPGHKTVFLFGCIGSNNQTQIVARLVQKDGFHLSS